jgi:hypothetical protein
VLPSEEDAPYRQEEGALASSRTLDEYSKDRCLDGFAAVDAASWIVPCGSPSVDATAS